KKQLLEDEELKEATKQIVTSIMTPEYPGPVGLMYEIIQGAGYWLVCDGKVLGDVQFICRPTAVEYKLYANTQENKLYVGEIENGKVIEIKDVQLGVKVFEAEPTNEEDYENPVTFGKLDGCVDPLPGPVAVIKPSQTSGNAPLIVQFDGGESKDLDGERIVDYSWNFGETERGAGANGKVEEHTFFTPGTYTVSLEVTDDEGLKDNTSVQITVSDPITTVSRENPDPCPDTVVVTETRVDTVVIVKENSCCDTVSNYLAVLVNDKQKQEVEEKSFVLAGGPMYIQNDGQLLEYAMGLDLQIRFPFKNKDQFHFLIDGTYFPQRRANPLDDRPHLWSELRDDIDPITGVLPLHWRRGTRRATASGGIGLDYKPKKKILLKGLYFQGILGIERTFNQEEYSDPLKDPSNTFIGFDLDVFFVESRIGLRKKHLEIYIGGRFLEESRPFSLVLANPLGGSHHRSFDNTIHAGINAWY
ncbi:MAG: PKD domain-containing protein, partial [Bacteroidota bacterium]